MKADAVKRYVAALVERAVMVAVVTFFGLWLEGESSLRKAAIAGISAAASVVLSLLGSQVGVSTSPAVLPTGLDPAESGNK